MEQDLLKAFDASKGNFALVATYDFDPVYFERRILPQDGFNGAERIIILMDKGRYQERLNNQEFMATGFNRQYLVIPVSRARGVFHPKLYLVLGEKKITAVIGSNNCTGAGTAYNMELCSVFSLSISEKETGNKDICLPLMQQTYQAFRTFCRDIGPLSKTLEDQVFKKIEGSYGWITGQKSSSSLQLLHSHEKPLWPEVERLLEGREIERIFILSPFFDDRLDFLKKIQGRWPSVPISIVAQQKYSTLPASELATLFKSSPIKHQLFQAKPQKMGRPVHAKAIAFETDKGTSWLTGSANATRAAVEGLNTETCLWFTTQEGPDYLFKSDNIDIETIDPAVFQSGKQDNPEDLKTEEKFPLNLRSAILDQDGVLTLDYETPPDTTNLVLRIRNFNERDPLFSIKVDPQTIRLEHKRMSDIRGTAFCQLSGVLNGQPVTGNIVALIQLNYLFRDRDGSGGGSGSNLNIIRDTGKGLIPHLDTLASPAEAIEFLNNCNIRFNDGGSHGGFGRENWNERDPFKTDNPPGWSLSLSQKEANDLRNAIRNFIERHQKEKLEKHIKRGNINGLANFMDIFRTLNSILITYHTRKVENSNDPVIPFGFVLSFVRKNIEILIGDLGHEENQSGYIAAIKENIRSDPEIIKNRLVTENVPAMIVAAIDVVIEVRALALKKGEGDSWASKHRLWVFDWIKENGLSMPTAEDISQARQEYSALS